MSGFGRTRAQRATLLLVGGLIAFAVGRWTATDERTPFARRGEIPALVTGTALVLDGDTIDLGGLRVRLFGIDAFERDQVCEHEDGSRYSCGQFSREVLLTAVGGSPVTCRRRDIDRYGRMVGVCTTRDIDLSAHLVEEGAALAYREYSKDYVDEEELARQARRGVWKGRFQPPWDYRHGATATR